MILNSSSANLTHRATIGKTRFWPPSAGFRPQKSYKVRTVLAVLIASTLTLSAGWFDFFCGPAPVHSATYRMWQANALKFLKLPPELQVIPETNHPAAFQPTGSLFLPSSHIVYSDSRKLPLWRGMDTSTNSIKVFKVQQGSKFAVAFHHAGDEEEAPSRNLKGLRVTVEFIRTTNGVPEAFTVKKIKSQTTGYRWLRDREGNLVYKEDTDGNFYLVRKPSRALVDEVCFVGLYDLGTNARVEEGATNQEKIDRASLRALEFESVFVTVQFVQNDPDFGEIVLEEGFDGFVVSPPEETND